MSSTFGGLSTALSALNAQRKGLEVTGQNIANANTPGYTRQRVVQQSVGAGTVPALWSRYDSVGNGVDASQVQRLSDDFLTARVQTEHGRLAALTTGQSTLAQVEAGFGEPGETGVAAQLSDLWGSFHDLASQPDQASARTTVLAKAATVADTFHRIDAGFVTQWSAQREQLRTTVDSANTAAAGVAELNASITRADQAGLPANELRDKRDDLVLQLSQLTGATSSAGPDGSLNVFVGGTAIVRGTDVQQLALTGATELDDQGTAPVALTWASDGYPVSGAGGQAGGQLEALGTTIPAYRSKLDAVAAGLAGAVNALHAPTLHGGTGASYDQDGNPGGDLLSGTTAATISVAITDPRKIAASGTPPTGGTGTLGTSVADALGRLGQSRTGPDAQYRQLVVDLGVQAQTVNRRVDIQDDVSTQADAAKEAQVGVSTDEEMVNLLSYQHAYEAAAKVMSAMDEMLDTLINRTGLG